MLDLWCLDLEHDKDPNRDKEVFIGGKEKRRPFGNKRAA
jgi:hypothetical protein